MERLAERIVKKKGFLRIVRSKTDDGVYHYSHSVQVAKRSPSIISIIPENTKSNPAPVKGEIRVLTKIVPKNGLLGLL